jgi:hypothetical protein
LDFKAGDKSFFVSIFGAGGAPVTPPISGGFYRLHGMFYDYYKKKIDDPLMISISFAMISRALPLDIDALMSTIPFENRSIVPSRDLTNDDIEAYAEDESWRFIHVKVGPGVPEAGVKGRIYGRFTPQPRGEAVVLMSKPKDKPEVIALTGGRVDEFVSENQFVLVQQPEDDSEPFAIVGLTKVYENSLKHLQIDWLQMGPAVIPHLQGDAFCMIDRKHTQRVSTSDSTMMGTVSLSTVLVPNCAGMARSAGFKVSWDTVVKLEPRLASGNTWKADAVNPDLTYANAINISRFYGDISCLRRASELGLVEFYAFTNRVFVNEEAYAKFLALSEEAKVEKSMDADLHPATGIQNAIFVMTTPASTCPIVDYVAVIGKPRAALLLAPAPGPEPKKAHVQEAPAPAAQKKPAAEKSV